MIIWKSKTTTEEVVEHKDMGKRSWRWVLELTKSNRSCGIGLCKQYSSEKRQEWAYTYSYYEIHLIPFYWSLGHNMCYYDTEHHRFSIGPIHFNWGN